MPEGDIGAVIDTLVFESGQGTQTSFVQVAASVFAVAYRGPADDGFVKTFGIDVSGNIGAAEIDFLEFETSDISDPDIIHVTGNIYAIALTDSTNRGKLKTLSIDSSGNIGAAFIDVFVFNATQCTNPRILNVYSGVYAIVYGGQLDDGFLTTLSIDAAGNISAAIIETFEFDASTGLQPDICHVSGTCFAIAYRGVDNDGFVCTISIANDGDIAAAITDILEFDASDCYTPRIIHISGDVFAVVYQGSGGHGTVTTFNIDSSGNIGAAAIDTFEFNSTLGHFPFILPVSGNVFAVVYQGPGSDGIIATFTIDGAGNIGAAVIDSLIFDSANGAYPEIIHISGNVYAVAYSGSASAGTVKTLDVVTLISTGTQHLLLMGVG
jgi:hypothetical protein